MSDLGMTFTREDRNAEVEKRLRETLEIGAPLIVVSACTHSALQFPRSVCRKYYEQERIRYSRTELAKTEIT